MAEPITNVLGIVGMENKGAYDANAYYEKLNVVSYQGSSYCALDSVHNVLPTNTTKWQLIAEKGDKGDTGPIGTSPVRGVDYWNASDIAAIESDLSDDVAEEVRTQIGSLTSATPLVASSTAEMTDTSRIYVNTSDGKWYYYNGESWEIGGTYQAALDSDSTNRNSNAINNINNELNFLRENVVTKFNDDANSIIPIKINRNQLELFEVEKAILEDGQIVTSDVVDIYKYTIKDEDIYMDIEMLPGGINHKGCITRLDENDELVYSDLNTFAGYKKIQLGSQGHRYIDLYLNYDKSNNLGVDYITIYRNIGTNSNNLNKIMLNPFNNIVGVGQYINNNILIDTTSDVIISNSYYCCKVDINNNYDYYKNEFDNCTNYEGCCYNSDDEYLGNIILETSSSTNPRTVHLKFQPNTSYIKLNIAKSESLYAIKKGNIDDNKKLFGTCLNKPYNFNGKKITFFGDSITWLGVNDGTSYAKYFSDLNGNTHDNFGISGRCIAERNGATQTISSEVKSKNLTNSDYIFVAGGVNDYGWDVPLGVSTDTVKTTFYGAMNDLASYLKTNYPTKEVIFILPIINTRTLTWGNQPLTYKLDDYRAIIYNVCIKNGFSVVNGLDFAFPDKESSIYTDLIYDNTHPSELGRKIYAKSLSSILN